MTRVVSAALVALLATAGALLAETQPGALPEAAEAEALAAPVATDRPPYREMSVPRARWEHRGNGELWTRVALSAVETHGQPLIETVPRDIGEWCPAYSENGPEDRAAFWVGLLSTLSRYESTWNPRAVGGNGRWFGLLQIYPPTAEFRDCRVQTGEGLKRASANLNCAVRIMAITVPRDEAISVKDTRWRGVAADWGPIRTPWMQRDMKRYTSRQTYCRRLEEVRPPARPVASAE
ncbi:transglycosylase SLT domain-containing protein [Alphaproteobacteria bacterium GH1-50]|uniref:Transglycosylase SLT domain-containing protein n=1 Tax=Kangsaoukella pontilimi TaxID=2691042 RepID=A0A7C9IEB4_9RHOB|nr:transglycosylase SLT domain-containing protein [Kangsaoukella pontilimi]MXQ06648.1 transglycosylase SLT domain-containing protein [Kangsaoukella pontilimi]